MVPMSRADAGPGTWVDRGRRVAASAQAPVVAGALLGLLAVVEAVARAAASGASTQFALVLCLLALATTLPLAFLRPTAAAVAVSVAGVVSLAFFHTLTVAGLGAQLVVLYRFGRNAPAQAGTRIGTPLLAVGTTVPYLVLALAGPRPADTAAAFLTVLLAASAPAAAWSGIARRARSEAAMQSAARQAVAGTLLEHTARAERARIARELHDVVAHHISMVAVQAETARLTTPGMPAAGEMRRLLGVLREDARTDAVDAVERRPQPGLGQLADLLDTARDASGTGARLILHGPPVPLDPGVELAAFRIVQEALTNARRHAPGAAVDVELHYAADALRVRVRDNGPGASPAGLVGGHGLLGMSERAAAVGGTLRTGPASGNGYLVEAVLPARSEESG